MAASAQGRAKSAARAAFLAGLAAVASLPLAVYLTRFSDTYELLHAGFAIPLAAGLGVLAIALARRAGRLEALRLGERRGRLVVVALLLGILGVCLALAGLVAVGVYGLLEYVGSRD